MILARGAHLGLDLTLPYRLLVITPLTDTRRLREETRKLCRQVGRIARDAVQTHARRAFVVDRATEVAVLLPLAPDDSNGKGIACAVASAIQETATTRGMLIDLLITVGGECREVAHFARALGEAHRARAIAVSLDWGARIVCFDDLGLYRLLFRVGEPDELRAFADDTLSILLEYDQHHDGSLLPTLDMFFFHNGRIARVAQALYVHSHSVRYRLRRIEELCGRSLEDPGWRQELQLALSVRRLQQDLNGTLGGRGRPIAQTSLGDPYLRDL
jgi:purine catabolism regulator